MAVIPAKAGIQETQIGMDPGFRRGDGLGDLRQRQENKRIRIWLKN
jgi:hypothetical protein